MYKRQVAGLGGYVRPESPVLKEKGLIEGKPNVYGSKETIKGLTILGSLGTSDQFEAVCWAQLFGLTGNDFEMLNMDRGPAVQAFKTGEGDAIACGGPPYNYESVSYTHLDVYKRQSSGSARVTRWPSPHVTI